MPTDSSGLKRVVIVGGGFGGLNAAKVLRQSSKLKILIVDRRNHHLFQPLLYQVAMAGLSESEITFPIRSVFRKNPNVEVLLAEVEDIDPDGNKLFTSEGPITFDYLILSCGAEHSYFSHNQWEEHAPGLKTVEQAREIRRRILLAFEKAEAHFAEEVQSDWLTFAVVGGGPTGVELAGTLAEIARHTLTRDFKHIRQETVRILLIEAGPKILSSFDFRLSARALRDLESLGVEVRLGCTVTDVTSVGIQTSDGFFRAKTVIWAAGVKPSPLNTRLNSPLDRSGRILVERDLSLAKYKHIFVIGDQAALLHGGIFLPGLAPVAMQEGRWAAKQILNDLKGRPRGAFRYRDRGQMATIGRARAVAQIKNLRVSGLLAWLLWLVIHIYYLIGFKNRIFVIWEWVCAYLTYRRGARLITNEDWRSTTPARTAAFRNSKL